MAMKQPPTKTSLKGASTEELVGELFNRSSNPKIAAELEKLVPGSVEWWRLTMAERAALIERVVSALKHLNTDSDGDLR
ncbi:hypothetical protein HF263_36295 [Rhizobium leguminosarum]|uniref:hypothetical protein n=1 Tax=Rhizobium leguminosarum TaxID=384 RepID=UPI001C91C898|nr:hypothetical protein [Rhizobium leguminosarum]MBY2996717.1 hypothetical protein [Rhizobium leguminosarum]MBY3061429.1 hypothetical protein [Rhizobium leguminosarum]